MSNQSDDVRGLQTDLTTAQLKKTLLEIEKIRHEVSVTPFAIRAAAITPLISVLITVSGFMFAIYQFQSQQRMQQASQMEEQRKSETKTALEQARLLQSQVRADLEDLLRFSRTNESSVAMAGLRFDDLNFQLILYGLSVGQEVPASPTNERSITVNLARAVIDDADVRTERDAAYVSLLFARWKDYSSYLKDRPDLAELVARKFVAAASDIYRKDPTLISAVAYDANVGAFHWPEGVSFDPAEAKHFEDLVVGFQAHALFVSQARQTQLREQFAAAIHNPKLQDQSTAAPARLEMP